jgi:hypothetical protein
MPQLASRVAAKKSHKGFLGAFSKGTSYTNGYYPAGQVIFGKVFQVTFSLGNGHFGDSTQTFSVPSGKLTVCY